MFKVTDQIRIIRDHSSGTFSKNGDIGVVVSALDYSHRTKPANSVWVKLSTGREQHQVWYFFVNHIELVNKESHLPDWF